MQVDDVVAQVDAALEKHQLTQNTLIVVTSDNGSFMYRLSDDDTDHTQDFRAVGYHPAYHQSNYIWRGTKADIYEGGHRVPLLVRWPEKIKAGSVCEQTTVLADWYATFSEITGHTLARDEAEDSFSFWPLLQGGKTWERPPVIHHSSNGMFAIRDGKWKLIAGNGSGGRQSPRGAAFERPYQLYDLEADPSETENQVDSHPEVAARLEASLNSIRAKGRSRP